MPKALGSDGGYCRKCGAQLLSVRKEVHEGFNRFSGEPEIKYLEEYHCPVFMALSRMAQFKTLFAKQGHYPNDNPNRDGDFLDRHMGKIVAAIIVGILVLGVSIGVLIS